MNIKFRRNYRLILIFLLSIGAFLAAGSTRIIAYNFGEGQATEIDGIDFENDVYLYDSSVMHEVEIDMTKEDYDQMISTYLETGEKEYFKVSVTIDGVTIPDVGIRLKGNKTLQQTVGGSINGAAGQLGNGGGNINNGQAANDQAAADADQAANGQAANAPAPRNGLNPPAGKQNGAAPPLNAELPENWQDMTQEERQNFLEENAQANGQANRGAVGGQGQMDGKGSGGNPPFLIKLDEYVSGQTYQNFSSISVRIGEDEALLAEPVTYSIHEQTGQIVPETAYAVVQAAENEPSLYVICENIDEEYIEKHFPDTDGILYKAGNFIGFEYKGDDPTLYADAYEQKTKENDADLAPLIRFLKFVNESSDQEFENELPQWLDIDSFIRMMALDNLLANNDSFIGLGSNYFLYYDSETEKFTMLSWDMNLAMGGMDEGAGMLGGDIPNGAQAGQANLPVGQGAGGVGPGRQGENELKDRFFENETFSAMYDAEYARLESIIFGEQIASGKIEELTRIFTEYNTENNVMDQSAYDSGVASIKSFLNL